MVCLVILLAVLLVHPLLVVLVLPQRTPASPCLVPTVPLLRMALLLVLLLKERPSPVVLPLQVPLLPSPDVLLNLPITTKPLRLVPKALLLLLSQLLLLHLSKPMCPLSQLNNWLQRLPWNKSKCLARSFT